MTSINPVARTIYSAAKYVREELPPDVLPRTLKDVSEELKKHLHDELRLFISHHVSLATLQQGS